MPKKYYTFMIDPEVAATLRAIKDRDGISESEQIRRGIRLWLESRSEGTAERKRAAARKRRVQ